MKEFEAFKQNLKLAGALVFLCFALTVSGCHKVTALPPGAINSFDATSYETLMTVKGAIDGFKAEYAGLPTNQRTAIAGPLDQAIGYYNQAETAWQQYHAGGATTTAAVSTAMAQLLASLGNLQTAVTNASKGVN